MLEPKNILRILRQELALQTRHCKLLEAQQQALLACDRVRFTEMQSAHKQILRELEVQHTERQAALQDEDGNLHSLTSLRECVPASSLRGLSGLEENLRATLKRVQTLTQRNQMLIQNELNYIAFTLDLFVEAGRCSDNSYGGGFRQAGRLLLDRVA